MKIYEKFKSYIVLALIISLLILFFFTVYYRYNYINSNLQLENTMQQMSIIETEINRQNKNIIDYKKEIEDQVNLISKINEKSSVYQKDIELLKIKLDKKDIQEEIKKDPIKANNNINKDINIQFKNIMELTKWNRL